MEPASSATETSDALRLRWAAERTLLAWVRTSLALSGLGFVMARLVVTVDLPGTSEHPIRHVAAVASLILGIAFVFVGAAVAAGAALRYRVFLGDAAPAGLLPPGSVLSFAASLIVSALGLLLALSLLALSI